MAEADLYFAPPAPEPAVLESGILEIVRPESWDAALAEKVNADMALGGSRVVEVPFIEAAIAAPPDDSGESNGGVWHVLDRLSAFAHGVARKLAGAIARCL